MLAAPAMPASPEQPPPASPAAHQPPRVHADHAVAAYANLCRGTLTPEEVVLDFGFNPNSFGRVLEEDVEIRHRVILSLPAAKRLLSLLNDIVRRHEANFGEIETDVRRRLLTPPPAGGDAGATSPPTAG